jgi:F-type H+-transporting ATPase subunit alpha
MGLVLYAANEGYLDGVEVNKIKDFEKALLGFATSEYSEFMQGIEESGDYNDDIGATLKELLEKFVSTQSW